MEIVMPHSLMKPLFFVVLVANGGYKMAVRRNNAGFNHARRLINGGKVVMDSDWSEAQPSEVK